MSYREIDAARLAIDCFDRQYRERGMRAQRSYPNEFLIQFLASRFFSLSTAERAGIAILEIGCGSGANLWAMAKEGFEVHGLDSSQAALDLAKTHIEGKWGVSAGLRLGDFATLPYDAGRFDAVVDVVSLQHLALADAARALAEVARVLKAGGGFFSYRLSDRSVMFSAPSAARIDAATLVNIGDPAMPLANNGPISFWNPGLATRAYRDAGLVVSTIERVGRTYATGAYVEYLAIAAGKPS